MTEYPARLLGRRPLAVDTLLSPRELPRLRSSDPENTNATFHGCDTRSHSQALCCTTAAAPRRSDIPPGTANPPDVCILVPLHVSAARLLPSLATAISTPSTRPLPGVPVGELHQRCPDCAARKP
jgi:hypothetical protein